MGKIEKKVYNEVAYSKDVAMSINEFSAYELDILLCLVYVSRTMLDNRNVPVDKNLILDLPASMVKSHLEGGTHNSRIKKALTNIFDTKIYLKDDKYTKIRHIFEALDYSKDYKTITFELKKEYISLFYNLTGNFTKHEIKEFTRLKSRYAKRIYQIIMSYRGLGSKSFSSSEFRKLLDIPDSYGWSDIDVKLIRKIKEELKENTNINSIELLKEKEGREIARVVLKWKISNPEILDTETEEEQKNADDNEASEESRENEKLYNNYKNMAKEIQEMIFKKAWEYFINESGHEEAGALTKRIWKNTEKTYIVKVLKGEI